MPKIDDSLKSDIVKWSAFYEHRIRNGSVRVVIVDGRLHKY
jgi:replication factor C subunit 3/5